MSVSGRGRFHPARDRRDDADGVAAVHRRLLVLQIADILVVHVDVDEAAQLSLLVVEMGLEAAVPPRQIGEQFAHGRAGDVDGVLFIRVRPERRRDENFRHG